MSTPIGIDGIGIIHNSYSPWVEIFRDFNKDGFPITFHGRQKIIPLQKRGAHLFTAASRSGEDNPNANPLQPSAYCDYDISILAKCSQVDEKYDCASLERLIGGMRFAGGVIRNVRVSMYDSEQNALSGLSHGFWVDDASHLLESSGPDLVDKLLGATMLKITPGKNSDESDGEQKQAARNANFSRQGLVMRAEKPKQEARGQGDGLMHSFAEPLLGIASYTHIMERKRSWMERKYRFGNMDGLATALL